MPQNWCLARYTAVELYVSGHRSGVFRFGAALWDASAILPTLLHIGMAEEASVDPLFVHFIQNSTFPVYEAYAISGAGDDRLRHDPMTLLYGVDNNIA